MMQVKSSAAQPREAPHSPGPEESKGLIEIVDYGDLVLHVTQESETAKHEAEFRVSSQALTSKSKYFERLLQTGRFGEGDSIERQHRRLREKYGDLANIPSDQLPVVMIEDIGRIPTVKSIRALFTDFLCILHGKSTQVKLPVVNLANLTIVADRFDAVGAVRSYVERKRLLKAIDGKTTTKQDASLSEEKMRQRLLVGLMLEYSPWVEKYSALLITKGSLSRDPDPADAQWWDLPGRVEDELSFRRDCVLETFQSLQTYFLGLYSTRIRQCRLGYDSSPECDSFQFGEMVRFFMRVGTLQLSGIILDPEKSSSSYEGDLYVLIERLKQIPEYQVDRNHSHCGIRTRLVPLLDFIAAALQNVGLCGDCWRVDWMKCAWMEAKRPLVWKRQAHTPHVNPDDHERRHGISRSLFMAANRDWE